MFGFTLAKEIKASRLFSLGSRNCVLFGLYLLFLIDLVVRGTWSKYFLSDYY